MTRRLSPATPRTDASFRPNRCSRSSRETRPRCGRNPKCHIFHYQLSGWKVFNVVSTWHSDVFDPLAGEPALAHGVLARLPHVRKRARQIIHRGFGRQLARRLGGGRRVYPMLQYMAHGAWMAHQDAICLAYCLEAHATIEAALEDLPSGGPHAALRNEIMRTRTVEEIIKKVCSGSMAAPVRRRVPWPDRF